MSSQPLATIGILSIGQMGQGIAKLLIAHNYRVLTNISDRSAATQTRAEEANIQLVDSDTDLVTHSDYIFSVVPPRDAAATALRIRTALTSTPASRDLSKDTLYYLDLNAISPKTVKSIAEAFERETPDLRFVDGGIIGSPPVQLPSDPSSWSKPGIPLSGPFTLQSAPQSGAHLAALLNTKHLNDSIGAASGLKCCFAALAKGTTALALQSFTTADSLDVLPQLQEYLDGYNPEVGARVRKWIPACPPKAYRWVEEMRQIGECFADAGGWKEQARVFREIADVYEGLARVVEGRGGTEGMRDVEGVVGALRGDLKE